MERSGHDRGLSGLGRYKQSGLLLRAAGVRLELGAESWREEGELGCVGFANVLAWTTGSKVRQGQWGGVRCKMYWRATGIGGCLGAGGGAW